MDGSFGRSEITPKNSQKISQKSASFGLTFSAFSEPRRCSGMSRKEWFRASGLGFPARNWEFHGVSAAKLDGEPIEMVWNVGFDGGIWKPFFATHRFFSQEIVLRNPFGALDRDLYWFTIYPFKIFKSTMHINILQLIHLVNHGCWPNKWVGRWMRSLWHPFQMDDLESRTASGNQMRKCGWKTSLH